MAMVLKAAGLTPNGRDQPRRDRSRLVGHARARSRGWRAKRLRRYASRQRREFLERGFVERALEGTIVAQQLLARRPFPGVEFGFMRVEIDVVVLADESASRTISASGRDSARPKPADAASPGSS